MHVCAFDGWCVAFAWLVLSLSGVPVFLQSYSHIKQVNKFCIAEFYAEKLLVYAPQAKEEAVLPAPIGRDHKFRPIALGESCFLLSMSTSTILTPRNVGTMLTGKGKHGFSDAHSGQLIFFSPVYINSPKNLLCKVGVLRYAKDQC